MSVPLSAAQRSAAPHQHVSTVGHTPPVKLTVPCPELWWVADDRPGTPPLWAVEHALRPVADWTLCGRGVWQFVEGTPAHPHVGRITPRPRWSADRRCWQCVRRAATTFTSAGAHLYDGTRARPLCGRRLTFGPPVPPVGPGLCGQCVRSFGYVTRWRDVPVPALGELGGAA